MNIKLSTLFLALLLLIAGCAPMQNAAEPAITPTPAPTPEPTPAVLSGEELCDEFHRLWAAAPAPDLAEYLPENMFAAENRWQIFGTDDADRTWLPAMAAELDIQLAQMLGDIINQLAVHPMAPEFTCAAHGDAPSWQLLLALIQSAADAEQAMAYIKDSLTLSVNAQPKADGSYALTANLEPLPFKEALALPGGPEGAMGLSFAYSYALTVFDEDAAEYDEYIQPPAEGNLASGIVWPLSEHTRLRKTWYADRAGGIRKHTGTDIWAPADAEIYSCTDGTVTYVGYSDGTGYAVVVTDDFGYEFHYYHMIRETDFLQEGDAVKAGELIGHVGNTGNSDLDHLHLTIVASDGLYINPYPYLSAIEP